MNSEENENSSKTEESSSKVRTISESSAVSDDGNASASGKRQRTTSLQFLVPGGIVGASPPKFVSLEEIMQAATKMQDMAIVHNIAIDDSFKLQRAEPPANSIHKVVKETMHRAFWDLLKTELEDDPPNYGQALTLLENIKEGLVALLLPCNGKIRQDIQEVLDMELIKQKAEKNILDFNHYAQYVLSVMSKLCAPVRDEKIKGLLDSTNVIDKYKGILEALDLMALDMANFTIEMARPEIIAHGVEIERKKFADVLAVQTGDGLEFTRKWLLKHVDTSEPAPPNTDFNTHIRNVTKRAFQEACIDLLEWDDQPFPETFVIDEARLHNLEVLTNRLIIIGTVLLVTGSYVGPDLHSIAAFKEKLKEHSIILLQAIQTEKELQTALVNVAEQVVNEVKEAQRTYNLTELTEDREKLLKEQITDIGKSDHRIRQLVRQRVKEFLVQILQSPSAGPQKVPAGLTALQKELTEIAGPFLRIISHNSTVFCIYYVDIVTAAMPKST